MVAFCTERIKPKMLRDVKTEALLIFIRTTLEQFFSDIEEGKTCYILGNDKENVLLEKVLKQLLEKLQRYVVNSQYIRQLTFNAKKNVYARIWKNGWHSG